MKSFGSPLLAGVCLLLLILALPASGEAEMREFTSQQGQKLKAELVANKGNGQVELRREDGRTFTVQASTFSLDDQAVIKAWAEKNPVKVDYRFDIKAVPEKVAGTRKNFGYKKVKNELWGYRVQLKNLARETVGDFKVEYRVFASNKADGAYISYEAGGYVPGETTLKGPYRYNETAEFLSKEVPLDMVDYDGVGDRYKDGLRGFMLRIKDAKGNVVLEWTTPTAGVKGKSWDSIPKAQEMRLPAAP